MAFGALLSGNFAFSWLYAAAEFKFGFPEVVTGLRAPFMKSELTLFRKVMLFLNSGALTVHHAGGAMIFVARAVGLLHVHQLMGAVPLGLQHFASGYVKYRSHTRTCVCVCVCVCV